MTDDEINIAIAESLGTHTVTTLPYDGGVVTHITDSKGRIKQIRVTDCGIRSVMEPLDWQRFPDYVNDLNACHEFENRLATEVSSGFSQSMHYAQKLGEITLNDNGRGWQPLSNADCFPICHATAAQRCEAYLKTISDP